LIQIVETLGLAIARQFACHAAGTNTITGHYDQGHAAYNLAAVMLGEGLSQVEIYDQTFMRIGEPLKRVTLEEAIQYDPIYMKFATQINILKYCKANAWKKLPGYLAGASVHELL
jgi:hypothetical protein